MAIVPTDGRNHVCEDGHFGPPPTFESVSVQMFQDHVQCDLTGVIEARLCIIGIPGITATSPIVIDASYDALAISAHVTDPDSTAERNDVVEVRAGLVGDGSSFELPVALLDDGSSTIFLEIQKVPGFGTDCFYDRVSGVCGCEAAQYPTFSGDPVAGDARYTRESGLFDFAQSFLGVDCALATRGRMPLFFRAGTPIDVSLRATDRQGNISAWPEPYRITTGVNSLTCAGDPCGCCLLLSSDPTVDCAGLALLSHG